MTKTRKKKSIKKMHRITGRIVCVCRKKQKQQKNKIRDHAQKQQNEKLINEFTK